MRTPIPTALGSGRGRLTGLALVASAALTWAFAGSAAAAPPTGDAAFAPARAAPPTGSGDGGLTLTQVGELERPIFADDAPGTGDALYVVESEGRIMVIDGGATLPTPFLDISDLVRCCGEQGLLSLAFHPDYKTNRLFYVYFNNEAGDLVLMEFRRSKTERFQALRSSGRQVLYIPHPVNGNHNGGTIAFGPDRFLYLAPGDGGSGNDPPNNAQNPELLLGKLLRIDPRKTCKGIVAQALKDRRPGKRRGTRKGKKRKRKGRSTGCVGKRRNGRKFRRQTVPYAVAKGNPFVAGAGRDEIYAVGLRNPFRFSFDAATGAIAIGDVGQGCREEIDYRLRSTIAGANFGWSGYEGRRVNDAGRVVAGTVFPILEYDNSNAGPGCPPLGSAFDGVSVIVGHVVRDERLASQYGRLLYTDSSNPQLRSLVPSQAGASDDQATGVQIPGVPFSFAEGWGNRLYAISGTGPVYRLDPS